MAALPLGLAGSFFLVHSVRAILAAEGQCQHCQGQWKRVWRTKGDGAYALGQSKKNCPEWISFLFVLLLLVKGLVLEMSHFVSFLNNAFSVVGGVFYLCWLLISIFSFFFFSSGRILTTKVQKYVFRNPRREYLWLFPGFVWAVFPWVWLLLLHPCILWSWHLFIFTKKKPITTWNTTSCSLQSVQHAGSVDRTYPEEADTGDCFE